MPDPCTAGYKGRTNDFSTSEPLEFDSRAGNRVIAREAAKPAANYSSICLDTSWHQLLSFAITAHNWTASSSTTVRLKLVDFKTSRRKQQGISILSASPDYSVPRSMLNQSIFPVIRRLASSDQKQPGYNAAALSISMPSESTCSTRGPQSCRSGEWGCCVQPRTM